jgi:hypothetical protein
MIRELINRFRSSWTEQMVSARRPQTAPIKVWFDPDTKTERSIEMARAACILGETIDMSRSGIGFLVPAIRVKEKYLVGHLRDLNIEIDLPSGKVYMRAIGRRYEKVGLHVSTERFLVGAEITELTGANQEAYEAFLKRGGHRIQKSTGEITVSI